MIDTSFKKFVGFLICAGAIALAASSHALLPPRPVEVTKLPSSVGLVFISGMKHCTAVKVAPKVFLTAAHCFQGYNGYDISLEQVSKNTLIRQTRTQIEKLEVHPGYRNPGKLKTILETAIGDLPDLAMFKVTNDIDVPSVKVNLDRVGVGQEVLIGGYGDQGKEICHSILHPCSLNMAPQFIAQIYHSFFITKPTSKNPYFLTAGDSGGPAYALNTRSGNLEVVGINSMLAPSNLSQLFDVAFGSNHPKTASLYIRMSEFGAWYVNILRELTRNEDDYKIEPINPEDLKILDDAPSLDDKTIFGADQIK